MKSAKMGKKSLLFVICLIGCSFAQQPPYKVCIAGATAVCQALDKGDSQVVCESIETKVDCALKLEAGQADLGVFSEEELLLLSVQQPSSHRVVAAIKDISRQDPYAFEAVAVVASSHAGGLAGLRDGRYCHPGLDVEDVRWSPRVLKAFEQAVAETATCSSSEARGKTAEEIEVQKLSDFFSAACRPGDWSKNATLDARLKSANPKLCSLCGGNNDCSSYVFNTGVSIAGVSANNRHVQALQCLVQGQNNSVAYVAWQHVKEFFNAGMVGSSTAYALLCPDGSVRPLTTELLAGASAPCAFVRQHYPALVAATSVADTLQARLREWWPSGTAPAGSSWQTVLFNAVVGGANARVEFLDLTSPANYTAQARNLTSVDATACLPAQRWCTVSSAEHTKCSWLRAASHILGLPPMLCQQRTTVLECLRDVKDDRADLIVTSSNYGYIARQHYHLTPVKIVQNSQSSSSSFSRVAALVKESSAQGDVTRFENLRGKNACFPEFGGIAFVSFVRAAHERGVLSAAQCDYARSVQEFFGRSCAGGALDAQHALLEHTSVNATALCSLCKAPIYNVTIAGSHDNFTCGWDDTSNLYFGDAGALRCLADPDADVAFVDIKNINAHLQALNLNGSQFRALCRNNQLAPTTGVNVPSDCLLSYVVDAEVLTRRNYPFYNSLSTSLDTIDAYFGYTISGAALIDFKIFSPFNGQADLLFKDSANGLTEPTNFADNVPARNYIELFAHLESCTGSAPGLASRSVLSILSLVIMSVLAIVVA